MSVTARVTHTFSKDGSAVALDAEPTLNDPTGVWGVWDNTTDTEAKDADDVTLSATGTTGKYSGDITELTSGHEYTYWVKSVYDGDTDYTEYTFTATAETVSIAICNEALAFLGSSSIVTGGTTVENTLCNRFYASARDEILASHPWNCAVTRKKIIQTDAPISGYSYAYNLPLDCLRVWRLIDWDYEYRVEGSTLVSDESETPDSWADETDYVANDVVTNDDITYTCIVSHTAGDDDEEPGVGANTDTYWTSSGGDYKCLPIVYIKQVTDISKWSPLLRQAIVLNLAIKLAIPLTESEKKSNELYAMLRDVLRRGKGIDAQEGTPASLQTIGWWGSRR